MFETDDGEAELHAGSTSGAFIVANRFPVHAPISLRAVSFYTSGWACGDEVEVIVYEDPSGSTSVPNPSMEVWRTSTELSGGGFQEVATEGLVLNADGNTEAAFFVAVANKAQRSYTLGIDTTGPVSGNAYVSIDGGLTFEPLSSIPILDGTPMIRAHEKKPGSCFVSSVTNRGDHR